MKTNGKRACPVCGTLFDDNSESCPVCALQGALKPQSDSISGVSSELRFEHYTVLQNADGTPLELGRGAMGVTYKAFDVHLRCPVALKIINARFIGDDSARHRFVREARAAASVRHPNVPVSLIGTFAVMALMGFSLNSLSLFGLVLAIGIDDRSGRLVRISPGWSSPLPSKAYRFWIRPSSPMP